jgi:hypothetical protein
MAANIHGIMKALIAYFFPSIANLNTQVQISSDLVLWSALTIVISILFQVIIYYLGKILQSERKVLLIMEISYGITSLLLLIIISTIILSPWYQHHMQKSLEFLYSNIESVIFLQIRFSLLNLVITFVSNIMVPLTHSSHNVIQIHVTLDKLFSPLSK